MITRKQQLARYMFPCDLLLWTRQLIQFFRVPTFYTFKSTVFEDIWLWTFPRSTFHHLICPSHSVHNRAHSILQDYQNVVVRDVLSIAPFIVGCVSSQQTCLALAMVLRLFPSPPSHLKENLPVTCYLVHTNLTLWV